MRVALTREISPSILDCELTHLSRQPIDLDAARAQHGAYERALEAAGCAVRRLGAGPDMPDSVFIEDAALVLAELAVVTRPGAVSRRVETPAVAEALARYRPVHFIVPPGTLDGGDVLVVGRRVYVGRSGRTNAEGVAQLASLLAPVGYGVTVVEVQGCLHLKSAVTAVGDHLLLVNPAWVPRGAFAGCDALDVDRREPGAANALAIGSAVIYPAAAFPETAARLARRGVDLRPVDVGELAKAEGGVTCCSLVLTDAPG